MSTSQLDTPFTRFKRGKNRGTHDRQTLYDIIDATPMCHFAYLADGRPVVTPTCHWRVGDEIHWHGSRISRALVSSLQGEVCVTVTLLDGLVLARSAFHHSANYRSAMVFGQPELIESDEEKERSLRAFIEALFPGRWDQLRPVTKKEMKATSVLKLSITEASAKVRSGGPIDDDEDLDWPVWAGELPLELFRGEPVQAEDQPGDIKVPDHLTSLGRAAG